MNATKSICRPFLVTVLSLVAVIGVCGCGESSLVVEIEKLGGEVFDTDRNGNVAVNLGDTQVTDAGLAVLEGRTNVDLLFLDNTQITDTGLKRLSGLTGLGLLSVTNTQITDAGLLHLKGLTKLRLLFLSNTQVTDAGLEHLKEMTDLGRLDLGSTQITDAGLVHLKALTELEQLELSNTKVTRDGVKSSNRHCQISPILSIECRIPFKTSPGSR